jgi:phenylacetate-CoA ligase
MIYDATAETMSREALEQLQLERLQATVQRAYRNVRFYRQALDAAGVDAERVRALADLRRFPLTTKDDLRRAYPYDMFAVPLREIVRIHKSSGTTGKPIVVGYTRNDVRRWSELVARQLAAVGLSDQDVVQVAFDYGLFTGGLGFHYGAERIGAAVIPTSSGGRLSDQLFIMKDYKTTALVTTPSHAVALAHLLPELGIHAEELHLKCGIFGAEPWSENLRVFLEERLRIRAYDSYGLSELTGPGVAAECEARQGLHVNEDHFLVEIVDPATGAAVPEGEEGELVFTTLAKEGCPLLRYRTGDLGRLLTGPCGCGRTFARMSRVAARTDDLITIRGAKLLPSQLAEALADVGGIERRLEVVLDTIADQDVLEMRVAMSQEGNLLDEVKTVERLRGQIGQRVEDLVGFAPKVTFVERATLETSGAKTVRVLDRRER